MAGVYRLLIWRTVPAVWHVQVSQRVYRQFVWLFIGEESVGSWRSTQQLFDDYQSLSSALSLYHSLSLSLSVCLYHSSSCHCCWLADYAWQCFFNWHVILVPSTLVVQINNQSYMCVCWLNWVTFDLDTWHAGQVGDSSRSQEEDKLGSCWRDLISMKSRPELEIVNKSQPARTLPAGQLPWLPLPWSVKVLLRCSERPQDSSEGFLLSFSFCFVSTFLCNIASYF